MSGPLRFGVDELGATDVGELEGAMEAARALEHAAGDVQAPADTALSDRVMATIADEPSPAPGGFLAPLRRAGVLGGFVESLRQAWRSLGSGRPAFARAVALAYVLLIAAAGISLAGAASFGAASALGLLPPQSTVAPLHDATEAPEITQAPAVESDEPSAEPSEAPETTPDETDGPDDHAGGTGPAASDDHDGGSGPEPSDESGGSSGPGGGGDDGSSGPGETDGTSGSGGGGGGLGD